MLAAKGKLAEDDILIKSKNEQVPATLGNYLKDYQIFTLPAAGSSYKVSSVERLSYLNQNPNARNLSQESRELLLKAFDLYDWLRFGQSELIIDSDEPVYLKRERTEQPSAPPEDIKLTGLTRVRAGSALPESEFPTPKIEPRPTPTAPPKFVPQNLGEPRPVSPAPKIDDFVKPKAPAPPASPSPSLGGQPPPVEKRLPTPPRPPSGTEELKNRRTNEPVNRRAEEPVNQRTGERTNTAVAESLDRKMDLQSGLNVIRIAAQKERSREQVIYRQVIVEVPPVAP